MSGSVPMIGSVRVLVTRKLTLQCLRPHPNRQTYLDCYRKPVKALFLTPAGSTQPLVLLRGRKTRCPCGVAPPAGCQAMKICPSNQLRLFPCLTFPFEHRLNAPPPPLASEVSV
jgi:hypothetical protein